MVWEVKGDFFICFNSPPKLGGVPSNGGVVLLIENPSVLRIAPLEGE